MNVIDLKEYLKNSNKINEGKEVDVYRYQDKVIKIFHKERKAPIDRISLEGLKKLITLPLKNFNVPLDLVYDGDVVIGYIEKFLSEEEIIEIDYEGIKEDIDILSENGFLIQDLFYNYMTSNGKLIFIDLTSYQYINTNVSFLKKQMNKKNTELMNNFLIGLTRFDAFKKGSKNEYTKIYLANLYRLENCPNEFYGETIKRCK